MKSSKTKLIIPSLLTILGCIALSAGSTYSLFTSESQNNITISSGKVALTSSISNLKGNVAVADESGTLKDENENKYKWGEDKTATTNEGTSTLDFGDNSNVVVNTSTGAVSVNNFAPGHKFSFDISLSNSSTIDILYNLSYKLASTSETTINKSFLSDLSMKLKLNGEDTDLNGIVSYKSNWIAVSGNSQPSYNTITVEIVYPVDKTIQHNVDNLVLVFAVNAIQANGGTANTGAESKGYKVETLSSDTTSIEVKTSENNNEVEVDGKNLTSYSNDIKVEASNAVVTLNNVNADNSSSSGESTSTKLEVSGSNTTVNIASSSSLKNYTISIPSSASGTTINIDSSSVENVSIDCEAENVKIVVTQTDKQITFKNVSATGGKTFTLTGATLTNSETEIQALSLFSNDISLLEKENKEDSIASKYNVKIEGKITLGSESNPLDSAVIDSVYYKAKGVRESYTDDNGQTKYRNYYLTPYVKDLTITNSYFDLNTEGSTAQSKVYNFIEFPYSNSLIPTQVNISNNTFDCKNMLHNVINMYAFTNNTKYTFNNNVFNNVNHKATQPYRFDNINNASGVTLEINNNEVNVTELSTKNSDNTLILLEKGTKDGNYNFSGLTFDINNLTYCVNGNRQSFGDKYIKITENQDYYISNLFSIYYDKAQTPQWPIVKLNGTSLSGVSDKVLITTSDKLKEVIKDAAAGSTINLELGSGEFQLPDANSDNTDTNRNITVNISGSTNAILKIFHPSRIAEGGYILYNRGIKYVFEGITIQGSSHDFDGIVTGNGITFKNCVIKSKQAFFGGTINFENCTFEYDSASDDYCFWTWGAETINVSNCTFNTSGKAIKLYGNNKTVLNISNSTFNTNYASSHNITPDKAVVEIGRESQYNNSDFEVNFDSVTATGFVNGKQGGKDNTTVSQNFDSNLYSDPYYNRNKSNKVVIKVNGSVKYSTNFNN